MMKAVWQRATKGKYYLPCWPLAAVHVLDGTSCIAAAARYTDGVDPWHILETGGAEIRSAIPMGSV